MVSIIIDDKPCSAKSTMTIIDAARANGIQIPALGYDPRVSPPSAAEVAFVETVEKGKPRFVSATSTQVADGMVVRTRSEALNSYRQIYLQALLKVKRFANRMPKGFAFRSMKELNNTVDEIDPTIYGFEEKIGEIERSLFS